MLQPRPFQKSQIKIIIMLHIRVGGDMSSEKSAGLLDTMRLLVVADRPFDLLDQVREIRGDGNVVLKGLQPLVEVLREYR